MGKGIIFLLVIFLLVYIIRKRNQFNKLRRQVKQQGANIGIQKEKRAACLNDALNIIKVNYKNEVEGIEKLTPKQQVDKLRYLNDLYPSLHSMSSYNETVNQAFALNKDISATQELLNGNIRIYNDAISAFPAVLVALLLGYKKEKFIDEENIEENKKLSKAEVDFSKF